MRAEFGSDVDRKGGQRGLTRESTRREHGPDTGRKHGPDRRVRHGPKTVSAGHGWNQRVERGGPNKLSPVGSTRTRRNGSRRAKIQTGQNGPGFPPWGRIHAEIPWIRTGPTYRTRPTSVPMAWTQHRERGERESRIPLAPCTVKSGQTRAGRRVEKIGRMRVKHGWEGGGGEKGV